MNINPIVTPVASASRKHVHAEFDAKPTPEKIRKRIFADDKVTSGFEYIYSPAKTYDESKFLVLANEKTVLVGACFFDSQPKLSNVHGKTMADDLEILFDPFDDSMGYVQFYFSLSGKTPRVQTTAHNDSEPLSEVILATHLPYPEAQSSGFDGVKLVKYRWWDEQIAGYAIAGSRCRWLFAWFETKEVFRNGKSAGFNVARYRPYMDEFSSWNFAGGNGSQDALSLGKLYMPGAPVATLEVGEPKLEGDVLTVEGAVKGQKSRTALSVINPLGDVVEAAAKWTGEKFTLEIKTNGLRGRYRIKSSAGEQAIEPGYVAVDLPEGKRAKEFQLSLTWDSPMGVIANYWTHERFDRDFGAFKKCGIQRCHWIEYSNWPSFWEGPALGTYWGKEYAKTVKHVGNYTQAACASAHRLGIEFIADLKTFDLGFNSYFTEKPFKKSSSWEVLEQKYSSCVPEIAAHPELTMQTNPAWRRKPNLPVGKVVFYSDVEFPAVKAGKVKVYASADNKKFTQIKATVKTGTVNRQHQRWTPAGNVADTGAGKAKNWFIEISGLKTDKRYLVFKIDGERFEFWHRGFMFAEAFGADGKACVVMPATGGTMEKGFTFWKGWQGWSNQTEAMIQRRNWWSDGVCVAFDEAQNMPTLLEPAFEETRQIWLDRIQMLIDLGVDGVDIRTYCHHNGPSHYLKYAFAQPVIDTFKSLYKREPGMNDADYEKVRNIRGDFYTQFMREASKLLKSKGKKLIAEVESGAEVPTNVHVRMQLPVQWKQWVKEGLLDEVHIKWLSPWSLFAHEDVLPFCRKHGVKVHVISRCLHYGPGRRHREAAMHLVADSVRSGFDGYRWYEQQNFSDLNQEGYPSFKGPIVDYFDTVRHTLDVLSRV
jgi:hypothetical protein